VAAVARAALRRWDLVVCTHIHLLPLAYAIARANRAPIVLFVYGLEVWRPTTKPLANKLARRVDAFVSIRTRTTSAFRSWAGLEGVREYQLENAIDIKRYGVAPKDEGLLERYGLRGKKVVLTMGRVAESYKGYDEIIEVMPMLSKAIPDVVYVVAGDGHDVGRLRAKARSLGVEARVVFTGLVPEAEKAAHYRLADVYAMPGTGPEFDRYPLRFVFLEAMACGVPVVGCIPEDEEERRVNGALLTEQVDPRDPGDIVRGIVAALRSGKREVPKGLERFTYENFERRLHAIIDDVMDGARG